MSGTNFVGSKISLISKAAIRYEGTLVDINAAESTVALENVISFGTENRHCTQPYPPSNTPYKFIKFRGSDIADLHVYEPTQPPPKDPAIIEATLTPSSPMVPGLPSTQMSPGGPVGNSTFSNSMTSSTSFGQANNSGVFSSYPTQPAPTPANSFQETGEVQDHGKPCDPSPAPVSTPQNDSKNDQTDANEETRNDGSGNYRGRGGRNNNNRRNSYRRYREGMPYTNKTLIFDADFDFDTSNAKFDKANLEEEFLKKMGKMTMSATMDDKEKDNKATPSSAEETNDTNDKGDQCYDKSKSFFDTISCEALEKESGVRRRPPSWHAERSLNSETFGEGVVSYQRRNYRGDYRGGRGGMNGPSNYGGGYVNYHNGPRYNNYNRGRPEYNHYYNNRGGYRNDGYRNNYNRHQSDDLGYNNREGGYRRENGYNNRENGYNNRENGYNNRENGYNNRENGYNNRDNGYNNRDSSYNNRERNYRDNNYNRSEYSDRNNYQRRDNYLRRDNNYQRRDNNDRNEEGRSSYRRADRGGRQQAQMEAT